MQSGEGQKDRLPPFHSPRFIPPVSFAWGKRFCFPLSLRMAEAVHGETGEEIFQEGIFRKNDSLVIPLQALAERRPEQNCGTILRRERFLP